MNGSCPTCKSTHTVPVPRGGRITNHLCPNCGTPLQRGTTGKSNGRYICPVMNHQVTLGLTGSVLERPHKVVFSSGWEHYRGGKFLRVEPDQQEKQHLDRIGAHILGPGCVVSNAIHPNKYQLDGLAEIERHIKQDENARAGLKLVAVDDSSPLTWLVNEAVTYRACNACGRQIPDITEYRMPTAWTARHAEARRGRSRTQRHIIEVTAGPHPAGTLACPDCDPRTPPRI